METSTKFQKGQLLFCSFRQVRASSFHYMQMDRKEKYTKRAADRSRKNRLRAKEKGKKNQALWDFVSQRYKFVVEEFEREYATMDENNTVAGNSATETTANTAPLPTAAIPPFQHLPPRRETLNGMNVLYDLGTINQLNLGDINLNLFGEQSRGGMRVFPQCIATHYYSQLRFSTNIWRKVVEIHCDFGSVYLVFSSKVCFYICII
jgi:hypothetical protein